MKIDIQIIQTVLDYTLKIVPIIISIIALIISIHTRGSSKREGKPNFRIVQNLWTKEPYFQLINEANSKLDEPLNPTYILLIPSKLFFVGKDGNRNSIMVFSPVSYNVITEQIVSGSTKNQIVTCKLPNNFFAKKGNRDVIKSKRIAGPSDELGLYVETFPFLLIISAIEYKYNKKDYTDVILSTSFYNGSLTIADFQNLCMYVKDNYMHEVLLPEDGVNIYQVAHKQVRNAVDNMKDNIKFFGGREDGYGLVLKKINSMISPHDIIGEMPIKK